MLFKGSSRKANLVTDPMKWMVVNPEVDRWHPRRLTIHSFETLSNDCLYESAGPGSEPCSDWTARSTSSSE